MTPLDPDRTLALAYVPASRRPALEALWRLDAAFASVLSTNREPLIGRIRLAWWREALEKLDREPPPPEPVLSGLAALVLPAGVTGAELAEMEAGWAVLLAPDPLGEADLDLYASARGGCLFELSARLLGAGSALEQAGARWALVDFARHCVDPRDSDAAMALARDAESPRRWPPALRPLGMLAELARRDCEPGRPRWERQGSPGRMLRMLRHRITGK
ncbi:squalene/phytoene synthase family protein [Allosphingosinicella sp.]|jgi:phytoene synthase|uniref:squalene/phytoene synthase family protein n=1 Tax=Allosphingosinicella sp. TaxID=2823234 RepID=UPI002EFAD58A